MRVIISLGLSVLLAGAASADPISGKDAKKMMFGAKAVVEFMPDSGLPVDQQEILAKVLSEQPYYGAIAVSPDEGLMSEATSAAANYHDTAAASAAALAECNAKKTGKTDCKVVALIRPKGWKERGFQLSAQAADGLKSSYPGKGGAMAISVATGLWGIGAGDGAAEAAIAACAAKSNLATDCAVAVAD